MSKFENNLSQGNVATQLIKFSLPFVISNLIQSLYSVADMVIVGQFAGTASMSGVNIGSQITLLVTNLIFGLAAGATVLIAQYLGADDKKSLKDTIGSLLTLLFWLAVVITLLLVFLRIPILKLLQADNYIDEASDYLAVTALGTIFIFMYNALSSILRGMGDSKRPLYFVAIACFVNIGLDLLMVGVFKWRAFGAALATIISQAVSVILCIIYLNRNNFIFRFGVSSFGFVPKQTKLLLKIGVPMSLQNVCVTFSFLCLTAMVNILDGSGISSAAIGAVGKINTFGVLPAFAMSNAISAMSAQNLGAGLLDRAKKTMKIGMLISFCISAVVFAVVNIFPRELLLCFGDDPALIDAGLEYIRTFSFDYLLVPIFSALVGLFIGSGHTTFAMITGIVSSLAGRIPSSYIFGMALGKGLWGVGLGAPVASFISLSAAVVFYFSKAWQKNKIIKNQK